MLCNVSPDSDSVVNNSVMLNVWRPLFSIISEFTQQGVGSGEPFIIPASDFK